LVKTVLSAMLTHFLIIYKLPKWAKQEIDHYHRSFLWHGEEPDKVRGALSGKMEDLHSPEEVGWPWDQRIRQVWESSLTLVVMAWLGHLGSTMEKHTEAP
jgi:hypothetical protein